MDNKNYKVVLLKTPDANDEMSGKLASLFKITPDKAAQMLTRDEFVIKKQADKQTAEKFHKAISATGARCRIDEIPDETESALPTIEDIAPPSEAAPLIDPTRPEITAQQQAPVDLGLEAINRPQPVSENPSIDGGIQPEQFCPECGTIREAADAVCKHCGYDPQESSSENSKSRWLKVAVAVIAVVVIAAVATPFLLNFKKRMQIEEDLQLAFDVRNQVTEFIQRTNFWPNQNIDAGLEKDFSNRSIKSVKVGENSVITTTLRASALEGEEQTLVFTPNTLKGRIVWNCLEGTLHPDYRPDICKSKP